MDIRKKKNTHAHTHIMGQALFSKRFDSFSRSEVRYFMIVCCVCKSSRENTSDAEDACPARRTAPTSNIPQTGVRISEPGLSLESESFRRAYFLQLMHDFYPRNRIKSRTRKETRPKRVHSLAETRKQKYMEGEPEQQIQQ